MSRVRRGMLLLVLGPALLVSGCIEYVIEAPDSDVVLLRGGGDRIAQMARNREQPILQQRQFGLFSGLSFLDGNKFGTALGTDQTLENVGIVTGKHGIDLAISIVSSFPLGYVSIVTSHTVRLFSDVQ